MASFLSAADCAHMSEPFLDNVEFKKQILLYLFFKINQWCFSPGVIFSKSFLPKSTIFASHESSKKSKMASVLFIRCKLRVRAESLLNDLEVKITNYLSQFSQNNHKAAALGFFPYIFSPKSTMIVSQNNPKWRRSCSSAADCACVAESLLDDLEVVKVIFDDADQMLDAVLLLFQVLLINME